MDDLNKTSKISSVTERLISLVMELSEEQQETLLEELTGEKEVTTEEGKIEVLGITEEQAPLLGNRFLIVILALIVAAVGGLILSFVIKARA
ncbi:MAG: hypothetical protein ABUK08_08575 [Candidatus Humimicrobiaceae bacterium]